MKRTLLIVVMIAAAGGLVYPSLAASFSGGDQIHENVTIEPHTGPNGAYARMVDDGTGDSELRLDFGASNPAVEGEGVIKNGTTPFDRVFNITYTGSEDVRVWVSTNVTGLTFYRADDPTATLAQRENGAVLQSNETLVVGILIDTTETTQFSNDEYTIHVESAT